MSRKLAFVYGVACYVGFLAVFLYAVGFVGNLLVPKSIDTGATSSLGVDLILDALLLGVFAIQHSGMARPGFKRWWTRVIPKSIERSTYVLLANLALVLLFWQWRPLPGVIWDVSAVWGQWLLWGLFALGWFIVLTATFMISHWHLFGLQQVAENMRGRPISEPKFMTPAYYRVIRHPIMAGFLIAFWATPHMTVGHLVFSLAVTGYIFIAVQFEQHDLIQHFGERYRAYMRQVPAFLPRLSGSGTSRSEETE
jgi:protein-S-isoprenylcysteine O-methyltransferase Ste14